MRIRALIVDDHLLFAESVRLVLEARGITVVGVAGSGSQALQAVEASCPELVLVDLGLPDGNGLAIGREIVERYPETKVLAITALEDPGAVRDALRAGFHGYLTKDTPVARFAQALDAVLGGQVVVPRRLASRAAGGQNSEDETVASRAGRLTLREREVLELLAEGNSGPAIAHRLRISPHTVRTHVQSILTKLQVHSRLEAASFAVRYRLVATPAGPAAGSNRDS